MLEKLQEHQKFRMGGRGGIECRHHIGTHVAQASSCKYNVAARIEEVRYNL